LKPNGRDGKDGTGRSPQSPAAHRASTLKRPEHPTKNSHIERRQRSPVMRPMPSSSRSSHCN